MFDEKSDSKVVYFKSYHMFDYGDGDKTIHMMDANLYPLTMTDDEIKNLFDEDVRSDIEIWIAHQHIYCSLTLSDREFFEHMHNSCECDGICDEFYPYEQCPHCFAAEQLNFITEDLARNRYRIENGITKLGKPKLVTDDMDECPHGFHGYCAQKDCTHHKEYK